MNPLLDRLHPYPFETLRRLTADIQPSPAHTPINLGIGEPQHATPPLIREALVAALAGLSRYPATAGEPKLRAAIAAWLHRRYAVTVDPATQVLPVNGSREALFAIAQTVIDRSRPHPTVVCPNPFYQIYEGAALLAGAEVVYAPSDAARGHAVNWDAVSPSTWSRTQLLYVCTPGNPTGAVMPMAEWQRLFELADRHGFVIASDECYSEIYPDEAHPPLGGLQAARLLGRSDFRRLLVFTSLSKRSNVPGIRSGFVAGDAAVVEPFLRYRTYHGSAMGPAVQAASIAAWDDEAHVRANRELYRLKFRHVAPMLSEVLDVEVPQAGFYLWAAVPGGDDLAFARGLLAQQNVTILPGRLLAREADGLDATNAGSPGNPANPGQGRIRLALVAPLDACVQAARRIAEFVASP